MRFRNKAYSMLQGKFTYDEIGQFIEEGSRILSYGSEQGEILLKIGTPEKLKSYHDILKSYEDNAQKAGMEVKYIDIHTDEILEHQLVSYLITGLNNKLNTSNDENKKRIEAGSIRMMEHLIYLRQGLADKSIAQKAIQHVNDLKTSCVYIGGMSHTDKKNYILNEYPETKCESLGYRLSQTKIPTYSSAVIHEGQFIADSDKEISDILSGKNPKSMIYPCKDLNSDESINLGLCVKENPHDPEDKRSIAVFKEGILFVNEP